MIQIPLTRGLFALVDDADFDWLNQWKWLAVKWKNGFYAARAIRHPDGTKSLVYMHRVLIVGKSKIDHWDGNGLNNQRHNLRPATCSQNGANRKKNTGECSSSFKGVHWTDKEKPWQSRIQVRGNRAYLGNFKTEEQAARAYDAEAKKQFGEFAKLNFPKQQ